jgi:hypothetical protein
MIKKKKTKNRCPESPVTREAETRGSWFKTSLGKKLSKSNQV